MYEALFVIFCFIAWQCIPKIYRAHRFNTIYADRLAQVLKLRQLLRNQHVPEDQLPDIEQVVLDDKEITFDNYCKHLLN